MQAGIKSDKANNKHQLKETYLLTWCKVCANYVAQTAKNS